MFKMDKQVLKKKVYDACYSRQVEKIRNIEQAMRDAQDSANVEEQPKDMYDASRIMLLGKRDMYSQQLQVELEQLETLHKIDLTVQHDTVEFGSVVETNLQKVFVSIGRGKFLVENDPYFAISPKVPFFQAIRGKKKGDEVLFNGRKVKILDIF